MNNYSQKNKEKMMSNELNAHEWQDNEISNDVKQKIENKEMKSQWQNEHGDYKDPMYDKRNKRDSLTHEHGAKVSDNQNSRTAGNRGPITLDDIWLMEKHAHFNREVIPERRMHAKGSGAFGTFKVTSPEIQKYSCARIFDTVGKETEMFVRFSTVAGERGAADAERDIRGFAMKFYTEDGIWDLVGNNTPVFFLRDPKKFPDLNHAIKRDPKTNMRSAKNNWDFWSGLPEAFHQVTIVMSDRGIPASYRHMHGFGSHTYALINDKNERTWCKFHFRTQQGIKNLTDEEAAELVGKDRESHQKDLFEAIERKEFPKWKMYIQVMSEEEAKAMKANPFDLTKVWSKKKFPLIEVGEFELNRNPENYFVDVEQAAFNPGHIVKGISYSPDRMLQARLFMYGDAQRYRLGVNHHLIPVNRSKYEINEYHRDGMMRVDENHGAKTSYEPNSDGAWTDHWDEKLEEAAGEVAFEYDFREDDNDYFSQPKALFDNMSDEQKALLFKNTANNMGDIPDYIKLRHIMHCYMCDEAYGEGVRIACGYERDLVDKFIEANKDNVIY